MQFKFNYKFSSILDYAKDELCPQIFENNILQPDVRNFIYEQTIQFFERRNIIKYQAFIIDCYIASSIASYSYKDDTDFDIKFVIDIPLFKKYNPSHKDNTSEDICDYLIDIARDSQELTACVPGTEHALDAYFYDEEEGIEDNLIKYDSLYSVGQNKWIKEPKPFPQEINPDFFLNKAKEYAEPYLNRISKDVEKVKRDSIDFLLLKDYLSNLDQSDLSEVYYLYNKQLMQIDNDIDKLIEDKDFVKKIRHDNFDKKELKTSIEQLGDSLNYGEGNLVFKILQRYGYVKILKEIKQNFKNKSFSEEDLPILMSIIS